MQPVAGFLIEKHTSSLKREFCQQIAFRLEIQCQLLPGSIPVTWRNHFLPRVPLVTHGDIFVCHNQGCVQRPGKLLNLLQCSG